jgi:glycosyltransferase involved in cell wall biosynthesis
MNKAIKSNSNLIKRSLIIPIYKNEANIPGLFAALSKLSNNLDEGLEVIFVVDGSPDKSYDLISQRIHEFSYDSVLILLSRNFGSFTAIRTGLQHARGKHIAVMAADLQEPPELIEQFFELLKKDAADVVFGQRMQRNDPPVQKFLANAYWNIYRKVILPDIPSGGVDIFACNQRVKSAVLSIEEPNSSLVAQLFWVGFRRSFIPYERQERQEGKSSWSLKKRIKYMLDSIFSYSDFPIMTVLWVGLTGLLITAAVGTVTLVAKLMGWIDVPGYTTMTLAILFFGSAILTTQGIIGCYLWRAFENTKKRPISIVQSVENNK